MTRRIAAYVMLAEPWFLAESIRSYYDVVDRLVMSFDRDHRSWTGRALPVDELLAVVHDLDVDGKIVVASGSFSSTDVPPLVNEHAQRQSCLAAAGDADWVLQIDTDEVLPNVESLLRATDHAAAAGRGAVEYPARWLYASLGGDRYLEGSTRFWRSSAHYPGPLAVRPDVELTLARQTSAPLWRVDLRTRNTDPLHAADAPVDEVVPLADAVLHYTWVRPEEALRRKGRSSGHAHDFDWDAAIDRWAFRTRHPWLTTLGSPVPRRPHPRHLRVARVDGPRPAWTSS
ncbi:hypothetical protein ACXR2U_19465 [Jatrophihabitans sp. YIM 134969]